jgi:hypothetical protein
MAAESKGQAHISQVTLVPKPPAGQSFKAPASQFVAHKRLAGNTFAIAWNSGFAPG